LVVGVVQEPLQLFARERTGLRVALVVVQVRDGVPLVADRHRERAERLLARRGPAVAGVGQVLAEQAKICLVAADRRGRQVVLGGQGQRPLVHVRRTPLPREVVGERQEAARQPLAVTDRVRTQAAGRLLRPPAAQHRLDHRVLRPQLPYAVNELSACRARQTNLSQRDPHRRMMGVSCIRRDPSINSTRLKPDLIGYLVRSSGRQLPESRIRLARLMQFPRVHIPAGGLRVGVAHQVTEDEYVDAGGGELGAESVPEPVRTDPNGEADSSLAQPRPARAARIVR